MKIIASLIAAAGLSLGGVVVAAPAHAAPHPSPTAYAHASSRAKFKRAPLTRQFCGPLPIGWPRWAPPLTPCTQPMTRQFFGTAPADWPAWARHR